MIGTGGLLASAALMGLAGTPHCASMCAAACAAVAQRCQPQQPARAVAGVLAGRLVAYTAAGAAAASVIGGLRWLAATAQWLHPLWLGLQLMLLVLGLSLLFSGQLPATVTAWLEPHGRSATLPAGAAKVHLPGELKAASVGLLWPLLPCGLLHGALLLASVSSSALEGAAVMATFAVTSVLGLLVGPAVWLRWLPAAWQQRLNGSGNTAVASLSLRLAGATVAVLVGWSLGHSLWHDTLAAWCA